MTPERWREVKAALDRLAVLGADKRAEALAELRERDAELAIEAESLLAAVPHDSFLALPATMLPPVEPGTRFGPYEVLNLLGRGGMGEVWRARDTTLRRDVALKVLPVDVAQDSTRLARLRNEAHVLASLNHPYIGTIYGFEAAGPSPALVLELVDGQTLAAGLSRGPLAIDTALRIAGQIAEALEAAHEHGIVHRDLKPANVMLRPDGSVKVLDFGLAKADPPAGTASGPSQTPTITAAGANTLPGAIIGTAAYMSPEQARGEVVDRRTDIWAFGCVLYEMLTGRAAFGAATVTETLAKILEGHPDLNALPATTPPALRRLIRRCLERSVRSRLQHIGDARADIADTRSGELAVTEGVHQVRGTKSIWALGALALSMAAAIVLTWQLRGGSAEVTDKMSVAIMPPASSLPFEFALSPDGRHILFVAAADGRQRLWLRSLDNDNFKQLPGTEDANYPFWSPDSRSIGFFASGKLRRIDLRGGPQTTLAAAQFGRGGSWNRDGTIIFSRLGEGLVKIPAGGGEEVAITRLSPPAETAHWWPQFLPDDRHFLFFVNGENPGVYLGSLDDAMTRRLTPSDTAAVHLPPDRLVFARRGVLVARDFDSATYEVSGPERVIADSVGADSTFRLGGFSVSANGWIVYQSPRARPKELAEYDRSGRLLGVVIGSDAIDVVANPDLSPDGNRVAVTLLVDNNVDVWLKDLKGGPPTRFTTDDLADAFPVWSGDGNQVAFTADRTQQIYVKRSSGVDKEDVLLDTKPAAPEDWSSDGRYVLYRTNRDLFALDRFAKPPIRLPVANSSHDEKNGQFSPDGRWVVYETNRSGRTEVVVQPFPGGEVRPVSHAGGTQPRWSGQEIFFVAPGGKLMVVSVTVHDKDLQLGTPVPLFTTRIGEGGASVLRPQYDVTREGHFLIAQPAEQSVPPLTLLLNWKPGP